jgi:hypothetical protein
MTNGQEHRELGKELAFDKSAAVVSPQSWGIMMNDLVKRHTGNTPHLHRMKDMDEPGEGNWFSRREDNR